MRTPLLSALLLGLLALGGCSLPQQQAGAPTEQRLGTQWGEGVASPVTSVALRRLSEQPVDRRQVFYSAASMDVPSRNCPWPRAGSASPYSTRMAASSTWCSTAAPCNSRVVKASATDCG